MYTREFSTDCPVGFRPIPRPHYWSKKGSSFDLPVLQLSIPYLCRNLDEVLNSLHDQIITSTEIRSACLTQLCKPGNDRFMIEITNDGVDQLRKQVDQVPTNIVYNQGTRSISLTLISINIFQNVIIP